MRCGPYIYIYIFFFGGGGSPTPTEAHFGLIILVAMNGKYTFGLQYCVGIDFIF